MKEKEILEKIEDDDRVVASMEGIEHPALFGRSFKKMETKEEVKKNPWENDELSKEDRKYAIRGAIGASLLIWLCYAVVFGIIILIMVLVGKKYF